MNAKQRLDELRFLHDRRMTLFNTRREHEWKIFFGTVGILLAFDASLIANKIQIQVGLRGWWCAFVGLLTIACGY
jgi:hypothetical protein